MYTKPIHADFYAQFSTEEIRSIYRRALPGAHPSIIVGREGMIALLSFQETRLRQGLNHKTNHCQASNQAMEAKDAQ